MMPRSKTNTSKERYKKKKNSPLTPPLSELPSALPPPMLVVLPFFPLPPPSPPPRPIHRLTLPILPSPPSIPDWELPGEAYDALLERRGVLGGEDGGICSEEGDGTIY